MRAGAFWLTFVFGAASLVGCSGAAPQGLIPSIDGGTLPPSEGGTTDGGTTESGPPPGDGSPAQAKLVPASIDFGQSDCGGAAPAPANITLSNTGGSPLTWSATVDSAAFQIVGPSQGSVPAGATQQLQLGAKAVPGNATAGATTSGKLTVMTSDAAHASFVVPVSITARGATLSVVPPVADFGQLPLNTQAPDIPVTLTNSGNAAAAVTFGPPMDSDFAVVWTGAPAPLAVAPGGSASAMARFRPTSTMGATASSVLTVTGAAVCGVSAANLALSGQGVAGVVGVSPASLDFGMVNCGTQASGKTVTLYNTGGAPYTWSATLSKGVSSPYVLSPANGIVPASSQATVQVLPSPIPPTSTTAADAYADTLTVTTDVVGDSPHILPLHETARGAVLSLSTSSVAFGSENVGTSGSQTFMISNAGNALANVSLSTGGPFTLSPPGPMPVVPASAAPVTVTFAPSVGSTLGPQSGSIGLSTSDAVCAPVPSGISLSGSAADVASKLAAGAFHTCASAASGALYCWGQNSYGQLGNGGLGDTNVATPVPSIVGAKWITGGTSHTCAVTSTGAVECWGDNTYGQLGNGGLTGSSVPVAVSGATAATRVHAGAYHSCALLPGQTLTCWGDNASGQLGNGTLVNSSVPVAVSNLTAVSSLAAGDSHTCAVSGGAVYCWGDNTYGQLGNGTNTASSVPVQVSGIATASMVTAGHTESCALLAGGSIACWGDNSLGALGNGTTTSSLVPVMVSGVTTAAAVDATGGSHVVARLTSGTVVCWGANDSGQCGNGTTTTPVLLASAVSGPAAVTWVATGGGRSFAASATTTWVCGLDYNGDLGVGQTGVEELTTVSVVGF